MFRLIPVFRVLPMLAILSAAPLSAQERPGLEQLEALRFERMREALALSEEQTQALRSKMEELRRRHQELRQGEREAMERLTEELRREPVDERAIRGTLQALETRRAEVERLRGEHQRHLSEVLRPEQHARFLLFNREFDSRLRMLIDGRRGRVLAPEARRAPPRGEFYRMPIVPPRFERDAIPDAPPRFERRLDHLPPEARQQEIERLRRQIERMQKRLEELERQRP